MAVAALVAATAMSVVMPRAIAQQDQPAIEITPAKVERDQTGSSVVVDYTLFNHDQVGPHVADVTVTGLAHDLDGTPQFDGPPPEAARLRASATRVTLAAGERRTVRLAGRIPSGVGGVYAGLVVVVDPDVPTPGGVQVRRRVAGEILVRGPRPWIETHVVEAVELTGRKGAAELIAVVRNTGDVHQRPQGTVTVFRGTKRLGSATMENQLVLPGSARRLRARWAGPPDAVGQGDLTFEATFGGETKRFGPGGRVLGPNETVPTTAPSETEDGDGDLGVARGLGVLFLALVIALLLWAWRRRRRRGDEDAGAAPAASG